MDFGNGKDTGQVILSTIDSIRQPKSEKFVTVDSLPFVTEEFGELLLQSDNDDLSSCSLAEALEKHDLFINSALARVGCSLLWQLCRNGFTTEGIIFKFRRFQGDAVAFVAAAHRANYFGVRAAHDC